MTRALDGARVALYARYSSDQQREASIEDQIRVCQEGIARLGEPASITPFTDYAISGTHTDRSGLTMLVEQIRQGVIDAVVVEDLSRLSRDFDDAAVMFEELRAAGVRIIGVSDGVDTGVEGAMFMARIRTVVNAEYIDQLRKKTHRGLVGRAKHGYATGNVGYGYRTLPEEVGGQVVGHRIEIDPETGPVVVRIFIMSRDGHSLSAIARALNADCIASPRERAKTRHKAKGWGPSTIRAILYNPKYAGVWVYNKQQWVTVKTTDPNNPMRKKKTRRPRERDVSEQVPSGGDGIREDLRIIEPDLWDAVQTRLAATKAKYTRRGRQGPGVDRHSYPLSGILRCGSCGTKFTIMSGASTGYYRCPSRKRNGTCTSRHSVKESVVREGILGTLEQTLVSPKALAYVRKQVAIQLGKAGPSREVVVREHRERLGRIEGEIEQLVTFIAKGNHSDYIATKLGDLEHQAKIERAALARLKTQSTAPLVLPNLDEITARVFDVRRLVAKNPKVARELLKQLFGDDGITMVAKDGLYVANGTLLPLVLLGGAKRETTRNQLNDSALFQRGSGDLLRDCNNVISLPFMWQQAA